MNHATRASTRTDDAAMRDDAIIVENLTKEFHVLQRERSVKSAALARLRLRFPQRREFIALQGVSFRVKRGEAVGVVGKNGSGKSTLLALLARIYQPTHGRIAVRGRVCTLLELGAGFHPEFTGVENIFLNGAILGLSRETLENRLEAIADFAGIGAFLNTPAKHYSSGMTTRLGFAIAAHADPDVLLVDEVLAVGDIAFQEKCYLKIEEFLRQGVTVFFVSHDMAALRRVCHRALWIDEHKLRADGDAAPILDEYEKQSAAAS